MFLSQITPDDLREFRNTWKMSSRTTGKHIERLKTFFRFALDFEWIKSNPAKPLAPPKVEDSEGVPFSEEEVEKILSACDEYDGNGKRLKALTLLMLSSGLRIGDASTISREKIIKDGSGWKVELRTPKTGTNVYCPIPADSAEAVASLPGKFPFWSGESNAEDCAAVHRKAC